MMALLLDTHVWLWLVAGDRNRLSEQAWSVLEAAADRNAIAVSEVSFWEIAVKSGKKRLEVLPNARTWLKQAARTPGIGIVQLDRDVMLTSAELKMPERDPMDRMLIATALKYGMQLVTADDAILRYASANSDLAVLDCRPGTA